MWRTLRVVQGSLVTDHWSVHRLAEREIVDLCSMDRSSRVGMAAPFPRTCGPCAPGGRRALRRVAERIACGPCAPGGRRALRRRYGPALRATNERDEFDAKPADSFRGAQVQAQVLRRTNIRDKSSVQHVAIMRAAQSCAVDSLTCRSSLPARGCRLSLQLNPCGRRQPQSSADSAMSSDSASSSLVRLRIRFAFSNQRA